jgi:hypothetical protein
LNYFDFFEERIFLLFFDLFAVVEIRDLKVRFKNKINTIKYETAKNNNLKGG